MDVLERQVDLQADNEATAPMPEAWAGFVPGRWQNEIDLRGFIQRNYTPYEGDQAFLAGPTARTRRSSACRPTSR